MFGNIGAPLEYARDDGLSYVSDSDREDGYREEDGVHMNAGDATPEVCDEAACTDRRRVGEVSVVR